MKINVHKLEIALAEQCLSASDLRQRGFSPATITRMRQGYNIGTKTVGKLAQVLDVPLDRLIEAREEVQ